MKLTGVYEGRIVTVGNGNVTAFVPQVFGDTTITISNFLGTPEVGRGWVTFQAGDPEHPVWLSGLGASSGGGGEGASIFITRDYRWVNQVTATNPGSGKIKVNNLDPALATEVYISAYDLDGTAYITALSLTTGDLFAVYLSGDVSTRVEYTVSAAIINNSGWLTIPVTLASNLGLRPGVPGNNAAVKVVVQTTGVGGAGEVYLGTSPPTDPGVELWYDTDATAPLPAAANVTFAPVGTIAATNAQTAIAEVATDAAAALAAATAAAPWISLTLTAPWNHYAGPYGPTYYRKVGDIVYLRGIISGGALGSNVCTLPVGYRPQYEPIITTAAYQGVAEIRVSTGGVVNVAGAQAGSVNVTTWLGLNNVFFSTT